MLSRISNPGLYSDSRLERFCWPDSIDPLDLCGSWQMKPSSTLRLSLPLLLSLSKFFSMNLSVLTSQLHSKSTLDKALAVLASLKADVGWDVTALIVSSLFPLLPHLLCWTFPQPGTISHLTFNELYNQSKAAINSIQRKREKNDWNTLRYGQTQHRKQLWHKQVVHNKSA